MNKVTRRNLILSRYFALFGVANVGLLPVSSVEIAQEARAIVRHRIGESVQDEETELPSRLTFDAEDAPDTEESILLGREQKAQLNRDVDSLHWSRGKARGMWLVVV